MAAHRQGHSRKAWNVPFQHRAHDWHAILTAASSSKAERVLLRETMSSILLISTASNLLISTPSVLFKISRQGTIPPADPLATQSLRQDARIGLFSFQDLGYFVPTSASE